MAIFEGKVAINLRPKSSERGAEPSLGLAKAYSLVMSVSDFS